MLFPRLRRFSSARSSAAASRFAHVIGPRRCSNASHVSIRLNILNKMVRKKTSRGSWERLVTMVGQRRGESMTKGMDRQISVSEFERNAIATDQLEARLETALLGLVGEVGSLVSALKKKRRDTDGFLGYHDAVVEELG